MKLRINPDKGADAKRLQATYNVRGYPTFLLVRAGEQPQRMDHGGPDRFSASVRNMRERRVQRSLREASERLRRRDTRGAIRLLSEVLGQRPRHADAWYWRGVAHQTAGDVERALADFMRALLVDRTMARAWSRLTQLSLDITRYTEAAQCATEFIANASTSDGERPWELRARARVGTGDLHGALEDAKRACRKGSTWSCDLVVGLQP